jgi:hypothetical protein
MRPLIVLAVLVVSAPSMAGTTMTFPVSIPQECFELAQREGVPVVIENKYQATKARVKLAHLSDRDPLVHRCRSAVERAKQARSSEH